MSEFVNTIHVLGDDVVCGSILDKTITEFKDDKITYVGDYAFYQCKSLEVLEIPSVTYIAQNAFRECTALTKVVLPSLNKMDDLIFYACTALTMVDFHSALSTVTNQVQGCTNLTAVIFRSETFIKNSKSGGFADTPIANGTGYIYVPRALVDTYKTATNWSTYANQFRALEDYTVDGTITGDLDESKI